MLKKLILVGALLVGANAAFASGLCITATLAALNGNTVACGTVTFDFTSLTFINANSGFGPNDSTFGGGDGNGGFLTPANILVTISDGWTINFSVTGGPGVWKAAADGSEPTGIGYSTYDIEYNIFIQNPHFFTQVETVGRNLVFNPVGGEIGVNKDVIYGGPGCDLAPYTGCTDIGAGFDENHDPGPFTAATSTFGPSILTPYTSGAHVVDFIQLTPLQNGNGNGVVTMDSFENVFSTPEPTTLLLLGSALLGLGIVRRKSRA